MLSPKKYNTPQSELQSIALDWLTKEITSGDDSRLIKLTLLLKNLYTASWHHKDEKIKNSTPLIISNADIQALLVKAMEEFLEKHPDSTTLDILDEKGDLGRLFKNCCVLTDSGYSYEYRRCTQFAFNAVIKHLSNQDSKPPLSKYKDACERMFREAALAISTYPEKLDTYFRHSKERCDWAHSSYFGSDNDLIDRFKSECFSQDEQAVGSSPSGTMTPHGQEGQD